MIDEQVRNWVRKAMEDFNVAKHELTFPENEISTGPVCFHCQQFVEKLLKAYLVSRNIEFGKTHNLEAILNLCSEQDNEFADITVGTLTNYAVEIRYPEEFYITSVEEAKECFKIASEIKGFAFKKLNIVEEDLK